MLNNQTRKLSHYAQKQVLGNDEDIQKIGVVSFGFVVFFFFDAMETRVILLNKVSIVNVFEKVKSIILQT